MNLIDDFKYQGKSINVESFTPEELIEAGQVTEEAADFLADVAKSREISGMIFGPTGSGKTTRLDTFIISNIPDNERILVIQEGDELKSKERYPNKTIVELYTQEGETPDSTFGISRLIEDVAVLLRPDRLLVGHIGKSIDGFKYLHTYGCSRWTTVSSDSAIGGLERIAKMIQEIQPGMDEIDILDEIYDLVDIIVYVDAGKITDIVELYQDDDWKNEYRPIFKHRKGEGLKRVGIISESLAIKLEDQGVDPSKWLKEVN